jgi:hypothetical protein
VSRAAVLGLLLALLAIPACGDRTLPPRVRAFASLPNWTGLWESELSKASATLSGHSDSASVDAQIIKSVKLIGHPPYNAEWEQKYLSAVRARAANTEATVNIKNCTIGFPIVLDAPHAFQIVVTPEETLFVFATGGVRHVYTDGRSHPGNDDIWPTRMGDSVGHWEGDTLEIDTIARTPGPIWPSAVTADLSEQAHFTEHVRMVGHDALEDQLTVEDPLRFDRPWHLLLRFSRVTDLNRMIPWDCEDDRNPVVDGKLGIAPP